MCIISFPVLSVNSTKIFIGINNDCTRQITVYCNKVHNKVSDNAMILPVPYPESVKLIDLTNYSNFFEKLDDCFETITNTRGTIVDNGTRVMLDCNSKIDVVSVGSYLTSIAKNIDDLVNIDSSVFNISPDCAESLKGYPEHYGFIVCKLAQENKKYHPFGYSHQIEKELFIPTKHYHGRTRSQEFFDHYIYTWNCWSDECHQYSSYGTSESTKKIKYKINEKMLGKLSFPPQFNLSKINEHIYKYRIKGQYPNKDFYATYQEVKPPEYSNLFYKTRPKTNNVCKMM